MFRGAIVMAACGCGRVGFDADAMVVDAMVADTPQTPITFVQAAAGAAGLTTFSLAFNSPLVAGHLIIVGLDFDMTTSIAPTQVIDTMQNVYRIVGPYDGPPNRQYIAYTIAKTSGPDTVMATPSGAANSYFELRIHEYAGVFSGDPLDAAAGATGSSLAVDGAASPLILTTAPNELIFGLAVFTPTNGASGTGFTRRTSFVGDVTEDLIAVSPGSYRATATMNSGTSWTITVAAFRGH
jgi:hypothetical protein